MKPRTKLRHQSKKREGEARLYAKRKKVFLEENVFCAKCNDWIAPQYRDLHHLFGRTHTLLYWVPGFVMLCRKCHDWVHRHVKDAQKLGLIAGPAEWGRMPK